MAKRKAKKSYTKRRRRSRMGAIGKIDLMAPIAMIGGAVVGRFLVNKFLAKQSGMIKGAAQFGAGIGVQLFVKNPIASVNSFRIISTAKEKKEVAKI